MISFAIGLGIGFFMKALKQWKEVKQKK
jgi:hypothetical protein